MKAKIEISKWNGDDFEVVFCVEESEVEEIDKIDFENYGRPIVRVKYTPSKPTVTP